jgi:hypothetical protein
MLLFVRWAGLQCDLKRMFGCPARCKLNITMGPPGSQTISAVGEAANTCARLRKLTKQYDCSVIIPRHAFRQIHSRESRICVSIKSVVKLDNHEPVQPRRSREVKISEGTARSPGGRCKYDDERHRLRRLLRHLTNLIVADVVAIRSLCCRTDSARRSHLSPKP